MFLIFAGVADLLYAYSCYLCEEGFIHLRFVKLVEKDGRRDGKNQPLYFITHELDILRVLSRFQRYEPWERTKKYLLLALLMNKVQPTLFSICCTSAVSVGTAVCSYLSSCSCQTSSTASRKTT